MSSSNSIQLPRYGITWALYRALSLLMAKNTPGLRCSWETMTRSVPLMTKVPRSVMVGRSPK